MFAKGKSNSQPLATAVDKGLAAAKPALTAVIVFSFVINLLILAGPLYMLQV